MLSELPQIEIDFIVSNASTIGSMDGGISIESISGGIPPYSLFWNTGDTVLILENLLPGNYDLTVTDANNCEREFCIFVDFVSNINTADLAGSSILLYPNPAKNFVALTFDKPANEHNLTWTLMSTNGQIVHAKTLNLSYDDLNIDLQNIPPGFYFWKLEADQTLITIDKLILME